MTNKDSYRSKRVSRLFTLRVLRPVLAISAVALSVFGLTQVSGTSAAWQDLGNSATSGGLTIASNVLPAVKFSNVKNSGSGGTQWCDLTWPHLGYPYKYRTEVYLNNTGSPVWAQDQDPGINAAAGTSITRGVGSDETNYHFTQTRYFTARVYTINRLTNEKSTDWRGQEIKRRAAFYEGTCNGDRESISGASLEGTFGDLNARMAVPTQTTSTTTPTTTVSSSSSTSTTEPATTTPIASTQTSTTTAAAPTTTTASTSTSVTATTTTATVTETSLGASEQSPSGDYSAALVRSTDTSQTAIVISGTDGDELKRLSATASTQYKWDSSTDALWIVDGGQLYKASGSSWTKTSVDPSSSEVPTDIAVLVE